VIISKPDWFSNLLFAARFVMHSHNIGDRLEVWNGFLVKGTFVFVICSKIRYAQPQHQVMEAKMYLFIIHLLNQMAAYICSLTLPSRTKSSGALKEKQKPLMPQLLVEDCFQTEENLVLERTSLEAAAAANPWVPVTPILAVSIMLDLVLSVASWGTWRRIISSTKYIFLLFTSVSTILDTNQTNQRVQFKFPMGLILVEFWRGTSHFFSMEAFSSWNI